MTGFSGVLGNLTAAASTDDKAKSGLLSDLGDALGGLANVIQVAGWLFPAASTAAGIVGALVGKQPEADPALQAIQDSIVHLIRDVHQMVDHFDIEVITTRTNDVQTSIDMANNHGPDAFPDLREHLVHDSMALERDLGSRSFWTRPFFAELVWTNQWTNAAPPTDPDGSVLDPRLTSAAYVRAITMWLAALALAFPDQRPAELDQDLPTILTRLEGYRTEWDSGLRTVPVPGPADVLLFVPPSPQRGPWALSGNYVGAVDAYSATPAVASVWPWPNPDDWTDEDTPRFNDGFPVFTIGANLGCQVRRKALYVHLGLADMWAAVQHLRRIAGQPEAFVDSGAAWSLREIAGYVSSVTVTPDPAVISGLSVLHALDIVAHRAPLIPGLTENRSLRQALDAATP